MSLRWIYENLEPPNVDEECSDIDDSCSDDSYDSDAMPNDSANNNYSDAERAKRETRRHHAAVPSIDQLRNRQLKAEQPEETTEPPCVPCEAERRLNNPVHQSLKLKLFSRTAHYIGVTPSGRVKGFAAESSDDAYVRLIVCPVSNGVVRLQSAETGHYLAFNATGHLYGEMRKDKDNTEWEQWNIGNYDAFRSHKYAADGWWLAIKKNGRQKPGPKTAWGQKAIQFIQIHLA
ncbi:fibroblast growth factor 1-like [Phymastichus coffea]|uniref:fibroblast growth factor 1-like n=1 Tax=Phymastichus coffea TaxID=108790 RepID=UPI00273AF689|nr:fibroblast growth factor 1-like [Phymastichus coffea]